MSSSKASLEVAILSGGCFWGVEELFRTHKGVVETVVGYTGGQTKDPVYSQVKTGMTGHAEAIQITFSPKEVSYDTLLDLFFRLHDPTTSNRQGNDVGSQYRSAIFYRSEDQKAAALKAVKRAEDSGRWERKVVTEVVPVETFYPAEEYHQKYLEKNPGGYTCHFIRD